jgi:predicted transcriptional regulator of viral defense system
VINMKYYEAFLKLEVFNLSDAQEVVGKLNSTKVLLNTYLKKGFLKRVRRNLYCAINLENRNTTANRYLIASKINDSSYVAFHSALEIYGYTNQVSFEVFVLSSKRFDEFEFEGVRYRYAGRGINDGIVKHKRNSKIKVTDLERSIVDSIKNIEYVGGFSELEECLAICPMLDKDKLKKYLTIYNSQFLYKKAGYYFDKYKQGLGITEGLLFYCEQEANAASRKYLCEEAKNGYGKLIKRWGLIVPEDFEKGAYGDGGIA